MNPQTQFSIEASTPDNFVPYMSSSKQHFNQQIAAGHNVFISAVLEGKAALKIAMQCNDRRESLEIPHPHLKTRSKSVFGRERHLLALNKQQGREALFEYVRYALAEAVRDGYQINQTEFIIITDAEQILAQADAPA